MTPSRIKLSLTIILLTLAATLHAQDYTHVGGRNIEGPVVRHMAYAVSYNSTTLCPDYVAWELTGKHLFINKASRTDEFTPDPALPATPPSQAYSRSGYDRGHMAPAADFKWSHTAMEESFYTSNICPQNNDLNAGNWLVLEKACRRWAKQCGKVWIVCGPVFQNGADERHIGNYGYAIRVPDAFFKAVLKTDDKGRFIALGWLMWNETPPEMTEERVLECYSVSINYLEKLTGYDFFSALPDDIEETVESSTDTELWK